MTPRSGWYSCASERGGGIACWLELMRTLNGRAPRDVLFVASSGHELGHRRRLRSLDRRLERRRRYRSDPHCRDLLSLVYACVPSCLRSRNWTWCGKHTRLLVRPLSRRRLKLGKQLAQLASTIRTVGSHVSRGSNCR